MRGNDLACFTFFKFLTSSNYFLYRESFSDMEAHLKLCTYERILVVSMDYLLTTKHMHILLVCYCHMNNLHSIIVVPCFKQSLFFFLETVILSFSSISNIDHIYYHNQAYLNIMYIFFGLLA